MLHLLKLNTVLCLFNFLLNLRQVNWRRLMQLNLECLHLQSFFGQTILEFDNGFTTLILQLLYLLAMLFSNLGNFLSKVRYDLLLIWSLEVKVGDFTFDIRVDVVHKVYESVPVNTFLFGSCTVLSPCSLAVFWRSIDVNPFKSRKDEVLVVRTVQFILMVSFV